MLSLQGHGNGKNAAQVPNVEVSHMILGIEGIQGLDEFGIEVGSMTGEASLCRRDHLHIAKGLPALDRHEFTKFKRSGIGTFPPSSKGCQLNGRQVAVERWN